MKDHHRRLLIKKYGHLYKRVVGFDLSKCAYCGYARENLDHVPAISLLENIDVDEYRKRGGKFLLYPSCGQCNRMLNNKPYVHYLDRLTYLEQKYMAKMDKVEVWSDYEMSQMGGNMKTYIEANQHKVQMYIRKAEKIDENRLAHADEDLA